MAKATAAPTRPYRGQSADERRAARRERLLEAALELLGSGGWQATIVTAVCERARLTPRYFYESFSDRDELLVTVFDRVMQDVSEQVLATIDDARGGVRETLRATIAAFVSVTSEDPRKGRVAFFEALGSEALMRRRFETMHWYANLITADARRTYEVPNGEGEGLEMAGLIAAGGLVEMVAAFLAGDVKGSPEELIDGYTRLCSASIEAALPDRLALQ